MSPKRPGLVGSAILLGLLVFNAVSFWLLSLGALAALVSGRADCWHNLCKFLFSRPNRFALVDQVDIPAALVDGRHYLAPMLVLMALIYFNAISVKKLFDGNCNYVFWACFANIGVGVYSIFLNNYLPVGLYAVVFPILLHLASFDFNYRESGPARPRAHFASPLFFRLLSVSCLIAAALVLALCHQNDWPEVVFNNAAGF